MADSFRTAIVPSANAEFARSLVAALSPGGSGMFTTPLSASGLDPATHYISTGYISSQLVSLMPLQTWEQDEEGNWTMTASTPGDAATVRAAAMAQGFTCTLAEVQALFTAADGTDQQPFVAMGRLGLQIVNPPLEEGP
jgi:hypothetical protein